MSRNGNERPRVLIAAFSARYALGQLLDGMFDAVSPRVYCRVLAPTNYRGKISGNFIFRARCGRTKIGGLFASISPLAHWDTIRALRLSRPDVVHILAGEGYTWAVTLTIAARLARIPVIVTLHDPEPHPGNVFELLNSVVRRPVLALVQVIHVLSSQHIAKARNLARNAEVVVISHGNLAAQFTKYCSPKVKRERLLLFFGRIQSYKGIDVLLRALPLLPEDVRLAIAGPGAIEPSIAEMAQSFHGRVELHNRYLTEQDVAELMQRAIVVALPYRHATQSSVPAIAAAFGCRLVATALGHFNEEIPRLGGLLVPPEDPGALAAALSAALEQGATPPVMTHTFDELAPRFVELYASTQTSRHALSRRPEQGLSP
ncbi:MAG TPA: glycosyltransferase [Rhodopila sp.]|nr:glycosyltransferase [Rhodopila sp.]